MEASACLSLFYEYVQHMLGLRAYPGHTTPEALTQRFATMLCEISMDNAQVLQHASPNMLNPDTQTECHRQSQYKFLPLNPKPPAYVVEQHDFVIVRHSVPGKDVREALNPRSPEQKAAFIDALIA